MVLVQYCPRQGRGVWGRSSRVGQVERRRTTGDLTERGFWRQVGLLAGRYGSGDVGEVADAGRLAGFELGHLSGVRYLHR
jgi:hypothetical protein